MSILIKGMEMPTDCILCPLFRSDWQECSLLHAKVYIKGIDADCPLVPIPPHGRLIDADALIKPRYQHIDVHTGEWYVEVRTIEAAPTIIPASEEGE